MKKGKNRVPYCRVATPLGGIEKDPLTTARLWLRSSYPTPIIIKLHFFSFLFLNCVVTCIPTILFIVISILDPFPFPIYFYCYHLFHITIFSLKIFFNYKLVLLSSAWIVNIKLFQLNQLIILNLSLGHATDSTPIRIKTFFLMILNNLKKILREKWIFFK